MSGGWNPQYYVGPDGDMYVLMTQANLTPPMIVPPLPGAAAPPPPKMPFVLAPMAQDINGGGRDDLVRILERQVVQILSLAEMVPMETLADASKRPSPCAQTLATGGAQEDRAAAALHAAQALAATMASHVDTAVRSHTSPGHDPRILVRPSHPSN